MRQSFKMENLDCANCAAKMERAINKLPGVNQAAISFMTQRFSLDANDAEFNSILARAVEVCKKIEPDCVIHI